MKKQCVVKVFPHTWTNGNQTFKELSAKLDEGWTVKLTILSYEDRGSKIYDYILEKDETVLPKKS